MLSCEPRFCMFIINGSYTKKQILVVFGLLVKRCNNILLCVVCLDRKYCRWNCATEDLNLYIKFIYAENVVRLVLFVVLLWLVILTGDFVFLCSWWPAEEYLLAALNMNIHYGSESCCGYLGWLTIMNPNTPKVKEGITHSKYSSYVFISCNISNIKHYSIICTTRVMIQYFGILLFFKGFSIENSCHFEFHYKVNKKSVLKNLNWLKGHKMCFSHCQGMIFIILLVILS